MDDFESFANCGEDERNMRAKEALGESRSYVLFFVDEKGNVGRFSDLSPNHIAENLGLISFGRSVLQRLELAAVDGAIEI